MNQITKGLSQVEYRLIRPIKIATIKVVPTDLASQDPISLDISVATASSSTIASST